MAETVHASPQDVKKLAAALAAYKGEVSAAGQKVQRALNAANWRDGQKERFEAHYREFHRAIERFMSGEVDTMVRDLNELARRLAEIQSMRM